MLLSIMQNYRNQAMHDSLERRFAVDFLSEFSMIMKNFKGVGIKVTTNNKISWEHIEISELLNYIN